MNPAALLQLPGFPPSAPVWLQWLVAVVLFLLVAGSAGLWLWKTRRTDNQALHTTTVADLKAALDAKKELVTRAEAAREEALARAKKAEEALADMSTEYDGLTGINTTLWLRWAEKGFQAEYEEMARQLAIAERDNLRLAREARDAEARLREKEGQP